MQSKDVLLAGQDIVKPTFCAGGDGDIVGLPNPVLTPDMTEVVGGIVEIEVVILVEVDVDIDDVDIDDVDTEVVVCIEVVSVEIDEMGIVVDGIVVDGISVVV